MGIIKTTLKTVPHKFHCGEIEVAVAKFFDPRQNLIVPNISWGMFVHECDLLVLTQSNYAYEIEIKISASDLKADSKKPHSHRSNKIKILYFALPEYLRDYHEMVPQRAGIIEVSRQNKWHWDYEHQKQIQDGEHDCCKIIRAPHVNREAGKWDDKQRMELMRLSTMRIWSLKEALNRKIERS